MTPAEFELLTRGTGMRLEIQCKDGEVMEIAVLLAIESEGDMIYELISTNRPQRYADRPAGEAYCTRFDEIESVRLLGQ